MSDTTYISPVINSEPLPSEGGQIIPPTEQKLAETLTPPVIADQTIPGTGGQNVENNSAKDQLFTGVFKVGTHIEIDSINQRILINDGNVNRILIGRYP